MRKQSIIEALNKANTELNAINHASNSALNLENNASDDIIVSRFNSIKNRANQGNNSQIFNDMQSKIKLLSKGTNFYIHDGNIELLKKQEIVQNTNSSIAAQITAPKQTIEPTNNPVNKAPQKVEKRKIQMLTTEQVMEIERKNAETREEEKRLARKKAKPSPSQSIGSEIDSNANNHFKQIVKANKDAIANLRIAIPGVTNNQAPNSLNTPIVPSKLKNNGLTIR